jgi:flagellar biosynthesis protein FlhB
MLEWYIAKLEAIVELLKSILTNLLDSIENYEFIILSLIFCFLAVAIYLTFIYYLDEILDYWDDWKEKKEIQNKLKNKGGQNGQV